MGELPNQGFRADTAGSFESLPPENLPTAQEFLRALLEPFPAGSATWLATFANTTAPKWNGALCTLDKLPDTEGMNCYYSAAVFDPGATARRIEQMLGVAVVVIDDPSTKGDAQAAVRRLGKPSFKIQTSRMSQQWGYLLKEPATDEEVAPVLQRIQALGLGDKSGNNAVRYARLPAGINNKPEHGETYSVHCISWHPDRRFNIAQIAEALEVGARRGETAASDARKADREDKKVANRTSIEELERLITSGESFHGPMTQLAARAVCSGESYGDAKVRLEALMLRSEGREDPERKASWQVTFDDIPKLLESALAKYPEMVVRSKLRREAKGGVISDEANVHLILEHDPALQGLVSYDEFAMRRTLLRSVPGDTKVVADSDTPRQWRDEDAVMLQEYVQRNYIPRIARDKVDGALGAWVRARWAYHPLRRYLKDLEWDGKERLGRWLVDYLGADNAPEAYLKAVGLRWMISAVARVMEPGCQADYAIVLEGAQGKKKSSALRALAGDDYFSDSLPHDLSSKDAADHVRGKWIIELPELAQFRRSEIETVKSFITRRVERFRPPYGRSEIEYPRQCVFAGTTNEDQYLVDDTGNRRFWPVHCAGVKLNALRRDRDQLWAEAFHRYTQGERWHLDQEAEALAEKQTAKRRLDDPWHDLVVEMLGKDGHFERSKQLRPGEVLQALGVKGDKLTSFNAGRVGKILKALKWRKKSRYYVRPEE